MSPNNSLSRGWLPGVLAALVGVFLIRSGPMGILFMVPLGFVGSFFGWKTAWTGALFVVLFDVLYSLGLSLFLGQSLGGFFGGLGYLALMTLAFTWLIAPPPGGPGILRTRAAYRLILGALVGTLAGQFVLSGVAESLTQIQAELISAMALTSAGADAARRSLLEQELSPERIMALINMVQVRGGLLGSMMLILFINRQVSLLVAALVCRRRGRPVEESGSLEAFHVPARLIWVFSLALGGILFFRLLTLSLPETLAWNLLTLCVLMYLAQGCGILRFFINRRTAGRRLLLAIGIVLVILSPGINVIALGLLMLLGVAEHWAPLRVVHNGPPSTPAV